MEPRLFEDDAPFAPMASPGARSGPRQPRAAAQQLGRRGRRRREGFILTTTPAALTRQVPLEPHNVVTVEPGLYFGADDPDAPAWCRGIGIRIEDDVLLTAAGPEVLTADAPKVPSAVEDAVAGNST